MQRIEVDSVRRGLLASIGVGVFQVACPQLHAGSMSNSFHREVAEKARSHGLAAGQKLAILIPHGCADNLSPVVREFTELTGIEISVSEAAVDDINTQLLLDRMNEKGLYDLALPATFGIPDLVASDVIIPLTDYAAKHEPDGFREDVLFPTGDTFDDEIYGFQTDGDAYVMFYNNHMMLNEYEQKAYEDRHGSALRVPDTWKELDRQIEFFHRPTEDMYGGVLFRNTGYLAWEWWVRFHAKGVWPLSPNLRPQIDSDAGREALEEMISVGRFLAPGVESMSLFENWERYSKGNIYANIGWGGTQKYLNSPASAMRGHLSYSATPGGSIDGSAVTTPYFNWGWNYVVTTQSSMPELAYLFALFASTPAMSTVAVRQQGGFFDPFRPEHYRDPGIVETYSAEFLAVHEASMRAAIPDLYLANQSLYFSSLGKWLARAIDGSISTEEALTHVSQQWTLINDRSEFSAQKERWAELRRKYPPRLSAVMSDL